MPITVRGLDQDIRRLTDELEREIRQIIVATDQAVVSGTPVDLGTLRANWLMDFGSVRARTTTSTAIPDTSRGNAWNFGDGNIFIHNSLDYAPVIDAGRGVRDGQLRGSEQAPQGIIDPAIAQIRARFG